MVTANRSITGPTPSFWHRSNGWPAGSASVIQVAPSASRVAPRADRPLGRRLVVVDLQVEVELLRALLARPLRGDVVGSALELDLLAVRRRAR